MRSSLGFLTSLETREEREMKRHFWYSGSHVSVKMGFE
jgi:hypothetical protein